MMMMMMMMTMMTMMMIMVIMVMMMMMWETCFLPMEGFGSAQFFLRVPEQLLGYNCSADARDFDQPGHHQKNVEEKIP
eukprot:3759909-Karenia_brevis.AAC.1